MKNTNEKEVTDKFQFDALIVYVRAERRCEESAVNQLMTLRNWAIGYYIVEYEQEGSDRAEYGSHLLKNLEKQLDQKGMNSTLFKACRQFYKVYPQIGSTVSNQFVTDPDVLVNNLSFSHIREIMVLDDAFERFFYETECMKCNWNKSTDKETGTMLSIKGPFTFEFLGLDARDAVSISIILLILFFIIGFYIAMLLLNERMMSSNMRI